MNANNFSSDEIQSKELEQAVNAALLLNSSSLPEITGWLKPEMFLDPDTGFIYSALLAQYNRGERPDYLTTENEMLKMDSERCARVGGLSSLTDAIRRIHDSRNVGIYAEEIKRRYLLRRLYMALSSLSDKALLHDSEPGDLLAETDREIVQIYQELQRSKGARQLKELAMEVLQGHIQQEEEEEKEEPYILSGFSGLDSVLGGIHRGELIVEGGRPGDGKTAIALEIGMNVALKGGKVVLFSQEMGNRPIINRLLAGYGNIDPYRLRIFELTQTETGNLQQLVDSWGPLQFYIDYTPANTVENIRSQLHLSSKMGPIDLVMIDYLQLLGGSQGYKETPNEVVSRKIKALKRLALELDCPILVLSQLNRQSENRHDKDHRPQLSDLRDSGSIEQEADVVFFIYRPERHGVLQDKHGRDLRQTVELIICKNRNGTTGSTYLRHNSSFTRFTDYDNTLF